MGLSKQVRAGSRVIIDGEPGNVWRRSGDKALIDWKTGKPLTLPDGRVLGYSTSQVHTEWIPLNSDRLTDPEPQPHSNQTTEGER